MNTKKIVSILTTLIIILTLVATLTGLLSRQIYSIPNIVTALGNLLNYIRLVYMRGILYPWHHRRLHRILLHL